MTHVSINRMTTAKRITANLPKDLLEEAMKVTRKGITETLVEGLRQVRRRHAYETAMALRGKIKLAIDLGGSRERRSSTKASSLYHSTEPSAASRVQMNGPTNNVGPPLTLLPARNSPRVP